MRGVWPLAGRQVAGIVGIAQRRWLSDQQRDTAGYVRSLAECSPVLGTVRVQLAFYLAYYRLQCLLVLEHGSAITRSLLLRAA